MTTFSNVVSNIETDIRRTDLTTTVKRYINRSIRHYYNEDNFYFNETSSTFSTVQDQKIYTSSDGIPTDIKEILLVKIDINSSTKIELTPRTLQYIEKHDINSLSGQPFEYAYFEENFYIYPIPDAAYTITVYYNKKYSDLSADGDENDYTIEAEDLIEARTRWYLYTHVIKNKESAEAAKGEEAEALSNLRKATARMVSVNKIEPSTF